MTIYIKYGDDKYTLDDCDFSWTTEELHKHVKDKLKEEGKSTENLYLSLSFDEDDLEKGKTLSAAGLYDGCTVDVTSTQSSSVQENEPSEHSDSDEENTQGVTFNEPQEHKKDVQIFIKKLDGVTVTMDVKLRWTQDLFVKEVAAVIRMDRSQFFLQYNSTQLRGDKTLKDANITDGCHVLVKARLRGGQYQ